MSRSAPNILVRAYQSLQEGTLKKKLAVRWHMFAYAWFKRTTWIIWYLGSAPWQCRIKAWYLRLQGAQVGSHLLMERAIIIKSVDGLRMGDHVGIGSFSLITCGGGVTIDDYVMISTGCRVISANHMVLPAGEQYRYAGHRSAPIHLKKGCWIATNAIVLPGVTIGEGAVVCAGSLVVGNVPDYAFVGGVPAKFMMYRDGHAPRSD